MFGLGEENIVDIFYYINILRNIEHGFRPIKIKYTDEFSLPQSIFNEFKIASSEQLNTGVD